MHSKIYVARAFRNQIDIVGAFKSAIQWGGTYYLDVALAFDWMHGSVAFQMTSETILYIMMQEN